MLEVLVDVVPEGGEEVVVGEGDGEMVLLDRGDRGVRVHPREGLVPRV